MLDRYLPSNPRARAAVISIASVVLLLVFTQLVLPGRSGQRGTPAAVLFAGLCQGAALSITCVGIVLLYRTMRVINFAQVAMGVAGTILTFEFVQYTALPFPIA